MIQKIKNNYKQLAIKTAKGLALLAGLLYLGANAPQWHLNWLESSVGKVVVKVVRDDQAISGGTGFHVKAKSGKTYILTNAHVCAVSEDGKEALIQIPKTDRFVKKKIIEVYKKHDLCLIEALEGYIGADLASSVEPGDNVRALGHPRLRPMRGALGEYLGDSDIQVVTAQLVYPEDALKCEQEGGQVMDWMFMSFCVKKYTAMETTVTIFSGSSGSPLVNFWGNVVGVIFAGDNKTNYGFAVHLDYVKDFLSVY